MEDWKGNTVVYTAVVTDFEHQGHQELTDGVDYRYFSDGTSQPLQSDWVVEELPDLGHIHPRRVSKLPKHCPHFFKSLEQYKYAIWIDGDMQILRPEFVPELLGYLQNGLVLSPHFDNRHCAYGEATIRPPKYQTEPMDQQVEFYHKDGFPEEFGLYETGVLAWDMTNCEAERLGQMWYLHNMVFSYQDQVSLPYALWKTGFQPDVLPQSFRYMDWVTINAHRSES